jgi:hypothetical protein
MRPKSRPISYVAFDKKTGRILHVHGRFSVEHNQYVEIDIGEMREKLAKDKMILDRLTDRDAENLDIIRAPEEGPSRALAYGMGIIDVNRKEIVGKPRLTLSAPKLELDGDGKDSIKIEIEAETDGNSAGIVDEDIKVTTTRGKLSARGGIVRLVRGKATITLTSVGETAHKVRIAATAPSGHYRSGYLTVAFV